MSPDLDRLPAETPRQRARALLARAERMAAAAEWEQARVLYSRAITIEPSPPSLIAFAAFLSDRDECDEAIILLEQAWDEACRLASPFVRAVCCLNLSMIHRRQGRDALAKQFHQLSLAAEMESPEFESEATLSRSQRVESAAQLSDAGDHDWAIRLLRGARSSFTGDVPADGAMAAGATAAMQARCGLIELAVGGLFDTSRQHSRNAEPMLCAHDLGNVGHLLQGMGRFAEAVWCFRLSARLFSEAGAVVRCRKARLFAREARRRGAIEACDLLRN